MSEPLTILDASPAPATHAEARRAIENLVRAAGVGASDEDFKLLARYLAEREQASRDRDERLLLHRPRQTDADSRMSALPDVKSR